MLTITEESAKYPEVGRIPDLGENEQAYAYVWAKFQILAGSEQALEAIWGDLVTWTGDPTPRPYPTWHAAATAALLQHTTAQQKMASQGVGVRPQVIVSEESQASLSSVLSRADAPDVQALAFSNCGKTAAAVLSGLEAVVPELAGLRVSAKAEEFDTDSREELMYRLGAAPSKGNVLLLDCSFPAVHTFIIEVRSDGRRYLVQGYQGAYHASWWQGTDETGLYLTKPGDGAGELVKKRYQADLNALLAARKTYGNGRSILAGEMHKFVHDTAAAFFDGSWSCFAKRWDELPFCPTTGEQYSIAQRGGTPTIEVTSYEFPDPTKGAGGSLCATVIPDKVRT
ncbi:MAG TPA: hypothetical protein VFC00_07210 [Micromonosporaceae bacterium]|nr:hypothetical protein [Micromonosporaceae bacterium]